MQLLGEIFFVFDVQIFCLGTSQTTYQSPPPPPPKKKEKRKIVHFISLYLDVSLITSKSSTILEADCRSFSVSVSLSSAHLWLVEMRLVTNPNSVLVFAEACAKEDYLQKRNANAPVFCRNRETLIAQNLRTIWKYSDEACTTRSHEGRALTFKGGGRDSVSAKLPSTVLINKTEYIVSIWSINSFFLASRCCKDLFL